MSEADLYFVGVLPSDPVFSDILKFKEICRDQFGSGRALRSPAHITLVPPFRARPDALNDITEVLENIASEIAPFNATTDHFGRFDQKVIFVRPGDDPLLALLYQKCNERMSERGHTKLSKRAFHPHMTIAFRDLTPENFALAWPYFNRQKYARNYEVNGLSLLLNSEKGWTVVKTFPFRGSE